jgi:CubicO group peptidase (beta-lactamase class C family)
MLGPSHGRHPDKPDRSGHSDPKVETFSLSPCLPGVNIIGILFFRTGCCVGWWFRMALILVGFCLSGALRCGAASGGELSSRFDEVVSHYARCGYFQGVVLAAQHGRVIYARGFGEANLASHVPNTAQTKFGIASITKQFTAALVLQQVGEGRIRLDGTVSEYLPWYRKDTGQRMTVDQLLHHTSGLPADYDDPEFCDTAQARRHYEPQEFAEKFCQPNLVAEPGKNWAYSNCGYVLLGLILERVAGERFESLLNERILGPLGMKDSGIDQNDLALRGGATGYTRHAGPRYTVGPALDRSHIFSAGAMCSSAEDLLRWNQALSSTNFFSEEIRRAMFSPGMHHWADGWFVTRISSNAPGAGSLLAEMRGDLPGNFFTWVLRYPEQDAVIIVLRNGYGSTEHLEENLQAVLFGQPPRLPSRSPKDVIAHAGQVAWGWTAGHFWVVGLGVLAVVGGRAFKGSRVWGVRGKLLKRSSSSSSSSSFS